MAPRHSTEQAVVATQLVAEIDEYEEGLTRLIDQHWDPELYRTLSDAFDRIQLLAALLPRLTYAWTELLISRVELTHALWSQRAPARVDGMVVALHERHRMLLRKLRQECMEYAVPATTRH
jgi:hypothetical protein